MSSELNQITGLSWRWRVFVSAALCLMAAFSIAGPADRATDVHAAQRFQLALEAQTARDYRAMLDLLREAATQGDAEAQEMLGMVLLTGPVLYGLSVRADRCEARQWMRQAAMQGSETAKVQLTFLNRLRHSPAGVKACD